MGFVDIAMVALLIVVALFQTVNATVYRVGDAAGWTNAGVDYKHWAATKTFNVGDIIVFKYISEFHNVMRVTHAMYKACNVSAPLATYTTGNNSIALKTRGHHYFLCGNPGHCQGGQKVDINVPRIHQELSPTPSASPSASTSTSTSATAAATTPSVAVARVPNPPNNAIFFKPLNGPFGGISLAMIPLVVFVLNFV